MISNTPCTIKSKNVMTQRNAGVVVCLILGLLLGSMNAKAQLYITGELGMGYTPQPKTTNKVSWVDPNASSEVWITKGGTFDMQIGAGVGYCINSKLHVGGALGYGLESYKQKRSLLLVTEEDISKTHNVFFGARVLYIPFSFFNDVMGIGIEAGPEVTLSFINDKKIHTAPNIKTETMGPKIMSTRFYLGAAPALIFNLSSHLQLQTTFDIARVYYRYGVDKTTSENTIEMNGKEVKITTTEKITRHSMGFGVWGRSEVAGQTPVRFSLKYIF